LIASPAFGASSKITGTLSKKGFTVVALTKDGKVATASAKNGSFSLKAPGGTVTLQLRDSHGRYAGAIVVGKSGGKVILGIRRGAKLGKVVIKSHYAAPKHKLAKRFVNSKVKATAKGGAPIGAGTFGLLAGKAHARQNPPPPNGGQNPPPPNGGQNPPPNGGQGPNPPVGQTGPPQGAAAAGADPDADGVPTAFDIDSNGNGVIDSVDSAQTGKPPAVSLFSQMFLTLPETVNANASAITNDQIDKAMVDFLRVTFVRVQDATELDCGGLSWCSAGGTGEKFTPAEEAGGTPPPFPACCDDDGDGLGTISGGRNGPAGPEFTIAPNAKSSEIGTGDSFIAHVTTGGTETLYPGTLNFVFSTSPAVKAWTDGSGKGGEITYPVADGAVGTQPNPIKLAKDSSGDYALTLVLWRPQRKAISGAGEGSDYVDLGHLLYEANVPNGGATGPPSGNNTSPQCPPATLSTADPNLTVEPGNIGRLRDKADDAAANPANTLTFTVNLSKCVTAKGNTLNAGTTINFDLGATSPSPFSSDHANQVVYVQTT
jgi:hypothetical protein